MDQTSPRPHRPAYSWPAPGRKNERRNALRGSLPHAFSPKSPIFLRAGPPFRVDSGAGRSIQLRIRNMVFSFPERSPFGIISPRIYLILFRRQQECLKNRKVFFALFSPLPQEESVLPSQRRFALLILAVVYPWAPTLSAGEPPRGFQALFDGKSLEGFEASENAKAHWRGGNRGLRY